MKKLLLMYTGLLVGGLSYAQNTPSENWNILSEIEYQKSTDEYGEIYVPDFKGDILGLKGKEISLDGYIIPFEGMFEPDHLIISSVPVASCFFCGGAGPESVAEIYLEEPTKYTAKKVTVTGKLVLNADDPDQLMYILKEARITIN